MLDIFLSASVPLPERHPRYFDSADVIAIRDSVRALVGVVVPTGRLVFGGHPAITPLIRLLIRDMSRSVRHHVTIFQSLYFASEFPPEVSEFEEVRRVDSVAGDRDASLRRMRETMIAAREFDAGIFVGGMDGVEMEFEIFRALQPSSPAYPIASTGAAARIIFDKYMPERRDLLEDLHYLSLFRRLLVTRT